MDYRPNPYNARKRYIYCCQMVQTWYQILPLSLSANRQCSISGWGAEWSHGKGGWGCGWVLLYKSHQDGFQVRIMLYFYIFQSKFLISILLISLVSYTLHMLSLLLFSLLSVTMSLLLSDVPWRVQNLRMERRRRVKEDSSTSSNVPPNQINLTNLRKTKPPHP